jgi:hypothetical protein
VNAPDIVRLRNGGILRGTISELVPGDYVTLVLITGETRKVPYPDVQYAGAANAEAGVPAPSAAPPAPVAAAPAAVVVPSPTDKPAENQPFAVVHSAESRVNVVSKQDGFTLFRRAASSEGVSGNYAVTVTGYAEVCSAPCNVSMPAGTHTFAVAKPGGKPHEAEPVVLPAGKSTMSIAVVDRTGVRVGVGLVGAVGLITGFALAISSSGDGSSGASDVVGPALLAGAGAGAIAIAFAISDGATVSVRPDPAASNSAGTRSTAWLDTRSLDTSLRRPYGLALSLRF